jgi:hypothetical protein
VKIWAAVGVALLAAGWFGFLTAYRSGHEAGSAAVRADWSEYMVKSEQAATKALRDAQAAYQADMRRREGVERELDAKLDVATRRGADLARRLRTQACPLPGASRDTTAQADGAAGESSDTRAVDAALAAHLAACERDAERLGELQRWLN